MESLTPTSCLVLMAVLTLSVANVEVQQAETSLIISAIMDKLDEKMQSLVDAETRSMEALSQRLNVQLKNVDDKLKLLNHRMNTKLDQIDKSAEKNFDNLEKGQRIFPLSISGYEHAPVPNRFFKLFTKPENWSEARKKCQLDGGDLVVVDHPLINDWLAKKDKQEMWLGATDKENEGNFVWTDGSNVTSQHWYPGEPNNCRKGQDCVVVNFRAPGKWDDLECDRKKRFVCQVEIDI